MTSSELTQAPRSASTRALLRSGLPEVFQDGDFGLRFLAALETVLDPVAAILDNLAAQFDPDLAAADVLRLLGGWLGTELDEEQPQERHRRAVASAAEVARLRGTRAGLERELALAFPGLPLRVEDGGHTAWAMRLEDLPDAGRAEVVVWCDAPVEQDVRVALARRIREATPAHVGFHLRVRAAEA